MTYQEIKTALRSFQAQGHIIPALNSKKEVLETALAELQAMTAEVAEVAIEETAHEEIPQVAIDPEPIAPPADILPLVPTPRPLTGWQLLRLELTDDLRFVGTVMIWGIALIRSIIRFSTPYAVRAANTALRIAVYAFVIFQQFILPKLLLLAYYLGIWGMTIALRIVRGRRGVAIA